MAQLFSQTAGLFQQSSKLQGGQVVYQVLENVIRCVTEPPQDRQAGHQQYQGCQLGPVTSGTWDGWMQTGIWHLQVLRNL